MGDTRVGWVGREGVSVAEKEVRGTREDGRKREKDTRGRDFFIDESGGEGKIRTGGRSGGEIYGTEVLG